MSHQPTSRNHNSGSPPSTAQQSVQELRDHDAVEKVVTYDDHTRLDGVMVILDWVTDESNENGTRLIHEKEYNGEISTVADLIDSLPGLNRTRGSSSGLARYTYHVEYTTAP